MYLRIKWIEQRVNLYGYEWRKFNVMNGGISNPSFDEFKYFHKCLRIQTTYDVDLSMSGILTV